MHARWSALVMVISLVVFGSLFSSGPAVAAPLATITVEAGQYARTDTPVSVPLASVPQAVAGQALSLQEVRSVEGVSPSNRGQDARDAAAGRTALAAETTRG